MCDCLKVKKREDEYLKLLAPWDIYAARLKALFAGDNDFLVSSCRPVDKDALSGGDYVIDIEVSDHEKYVALDRVLRREIVFGNVVLVILLYDVTNDEANPYTSVFKTLFKDNPHALDLVEHVDSAGQVWSYLRFVPEVIQYYADNLADFSGLQTDLAQDIASNVFLDHVGINFCTAPKDGYLAKPIHGRTTSLGGGTINSEEAKA